MAEGAMKLVILKWADPASPGDTGWHTPQELIRNLTPTIVMSAGWVIHEDENAVILAGSVADDGVQCSGETVIPRGCILARDEI